MYASPPGLYANPPRTYADGAKVYANPTEVYANPPGVNAKLPGVYASSVCCMLTIRERNYILFLLYMKYKRLNHSCG